MNTEKKVDIDSLFHPVGWKPVDKECESCYNYLGSHRCDICKDFQYYQKGDTEDGKEKDIYR